jgi:hypothetical protein
MTSLRDGGNGSRAGRLRFLWEEFGRGRLDVVVLLRCLRTALGVMEA